MSSVKDFPWDWKHFTDDGLVRTGQGVLHTIVLNQVDTEGLIYVADGTPEAFPLTFPVVWDELELATIASSAAQPKTLMFDLEFHDSLYVDLIGTWDITVNYK